MISAHICALNALQRAALYALIDRREKKNGAGNEVRTRDLNLGKVALYQLSYSRKKWRPLGGSNPCSRRERAVS